VNVHVEEIDDVDEVVIAPDRPKAKEVRAA
jgi:hypothetical protein